MEKITIDLGSEDHLTRLAQLIMNKFSDFNQCTVDEMKDFIKIRVNQIMEGRA